MWSRSVRRILFRLILFATPIVLLLATAFSLLLAGTKDLFQTRDAAGFDGEQTQPCRGISRSQEHPAQQEDLERQLQHLKLVIAQLEDRLSKRRDETLGDGGSRRSNPCTSSYIQKQIEQSELEQGKKWHNEYEVVPHALFTLNAFYPTEPGLGRRVVERPIGTRRQDLQEAVSSALSVLNHGEIVKRYSAQDFSEGLYRIDPIEGTQYELWFLRQHSPGNASISKVSLLRPHAPLSIVRIEHHNLQEKKDPILNIVVPLSGRFQAFQSFLTRLQKTVLMFLSDDQSNKVHLTVVFFGEQGWSDVQREMLAFEKRNRFSNFHLLNINGTFSRARGLQIGVEHWEGPSDEDVLVFLCDVDIDFDAKFLDRCRRNTRPKRQAYFPMVFSLYNPNVTQRAQPVRDENGTPNLSKETGFWRDFGFGMACTFRSDFLSLGGFHGGEKTTGWGGEDLFLYRKYIRSHLRVIRAPDPGLFHLWHPKQCPASLGVVQQRACLQSRARTEASHDQLGLLFFAANEKVAPHPPMPKIP